MRYYFPFVILLFSYCTSHDQKTIVQNTFNELDTLSKYSYPLLGVMTVGDSLKAFPIGTCFFFKYDSMTLIITAKHNVSGYSTFTLEPHLISYDTVTIGFYDTITNNYINSDLQLIADAKKQMQNEYFFNKADLAIMLFNDTTLAPYINPINSILFDTIVTDEILDKTILFGFVGDSTQEYKKETKATFYEGQYIPINTGYPINKDIYYTMQPISKYGMSGAPVFFKYIRPDKSVHIVFGGVQFGKNDSFNVAYSVIPEVVIDRVKYLLDKYKQHTGR